MDLRTPLNILKVTVHPQSQEFGVREEQWTEQRPKSNKQKQNPLGTKVSQKTYRVPCKALPETRKSKVPWRYFFKFLPSFSSYCLDQSLKSRQARKTLNHNNQNLKAWPLNWISFDLKYSEKVVESLNTPKNNLHHKFTSIVAKFTYTFELTVL